MNEYVGKICPYCKTAFVEGDDIVVCSDCDMPHHKSCWIDNKGCTTFGCQGTIQGIDFGADMGISAAPKYDVRDTGTINVEDQPAFCSKCGASLDPGTVFCPKCGNQVQTSQKINANGYTQTISEMKTKMTSEIQAMVKEYKTNDYLDAELGDYIGSKQDYYLKEFSILKEQKKYNSWNTFAFLISPFWCMYRKMYIAGGVLLGIDFILSIIGGAISAILGLAIAVLVGIFGNYYYMYDLEQRIARGKGLEGAQKQNYIEQKGDTNVSIPAVVAVIYALISVILFV